MSGPPYPPPTPSGSNAIGSFVVGVSPIGTMPSFNVWQTVIAQYANSPILTQLITDFAKYVDLTQNLDMFFDMVWNVDTAQGNGLDVWGRIVGVQRVLNVSVGEWFGFTGATGRSGDSFGAQAFFTGQQVTNNFSLSDSAFRTLILAKALSNISDGSIKAINQLLLNLFPRRGNCYVTDGQDMTMTYTFSFPLSTVEQAIVGQSGVLPRPAGVQVSVVVPP